METLFSIMVGVGLSAACGFRVFVPLFIMSVASWSGHLTLGEEFAWMASPAAMVAFGTACVLEVGGYYVPWLDNLLDTIATPAAVVAGSIASASLITDMSPLMQWSVGIIAGGGAAGTVQAATVAVRGGSSATTGGLGNFAVSTGELAGAAGTGILAIVAPIIALTLVFLFVLFVAWFFWRIFRRPRTADGTTGTTSPNPPAT
ncbi:MAG: DUF4126 domain-containing protein [Puniceicoccaceae bacterium]|nr:MAG: DUF4126 domain-containing protein [Puniceicoccaceae bacterium]